MEKDKRVRRIKSILLFGPYFLILIPIILCVVLLCIVISQNKRMASYEEELSYISSSQQEIDYEINSTQEELSSLNQSVDDISGSIDKLSEKVSLYSDTTVTRTNDEWPRKVYLTFDDGPSANTGKILDILDEYGVKGNFFVVGTENESLKKYYKRIVDEGHVIGMHSYSHKYSEVYASKEAFTEDLDKIYTLIYDETGVAPTIYRFPGGSSNSVSRVPMDELIEILDKRGIEYYDWNVLSGDATNPILPAEDIIKNSLSTIGEYEEAMILFHDLSNKTTTVEALPTIIEALLDEGITIAPIDDTTMKIQHNKNNE